MLDIRMDVADLSGLSVLSKTMTHFAVDMTNCIFKLRTVPHVVFHAFKREQLGKYVLRI